MRISLAKAVRLLAALALVVVTLVSAAAAMRRRDTDRMRLAWQGFLSGLFLETGEGMHRKRATAGGHAGPASKIPRMYRIHKQSVPADAKAPAVGHEGPGMEDSEWHVSDVFHFSRHHHDSPARQGGVTKADRHGAGCTNFQIRACKMKCDEQAENLKIDEKIQRVDPYFKDPSLKKDSASPDW